MVSKSRKDTNQHIHEVSHLSKNNRIIQPKYRFEQSLTIFGIVLTACLFAYALFALLFDISERTLDKGTLFEYVLFISLISTLIYGSFIYQFTRIGYLKRSRKHKPTTFKEENKFLARDNFPLLTILVPSYKEDKEVISQTLFSAALQRYPNRRVVLLLDDPVKNISETDLLNLNISKNVTREIQSLLNKESVKYQKAFEEFNERTARVINIEEELSILISLYVQVSYWFNKLAGKKTIENHFDSFFVSKILLDQRDYYKQKAEYLETLLGNSEDITKEWISYEYQNLTYIFNAEITFFQRKQYQNLSHEPNKAANLNSYIGLIGKQYNEIEREDGLYLEETELQNADLIIPQTEYVINLDADSIILPQYAQHLIIFLERGENKNIGVVQTPYNAFPDAPTSIERIAGATTDIQYLIHQGFTFYDATYWVGANALMRKAALDAIETTEEERGFTIKKYIQDRTVIEDTESTIDLIARKWRLYNYPERLAFSATPPDFGALLVQRCRWANGGLIILPKLFKYFFQKPKSTDALKEFFVRFHYLSSIALVNVSLLILIFYPFKDTITISSALPLTAVPYYLLYSRDLRLIGYKYTDIFRVYSLNLLLLPINLGGVFTSIRQWITKKKIPFKRTPKVLGRTASPLSYLLLEYIFLFYLLFAFAMDVYSHKYTHAVFSLINALVFAYIIIVFIGVKESFEDLKAYVKMIKFPSLFNKKLEIE